jgi:hypothetical protein
MSKNIKNILQGQVTEAWEGLGEAPDTPVQKGIEQFIEWYKQYFSPL